MQKLGGIVEEERLLITMPWGIGDAIVVGLSAVDQITRNDPQGNVAIDLLCNHSQTELLMADPRIHCIIEVDKKLFPTNEAGTWKRGIFLRSAQSAEIDAPIPLYIYPEHLQNAWQEIMHVRKQAFHSQEQCTLLMVAPDTSSEITRPPTALLAEGVAGALNNDQCSGEPIRLCMDIAHAPLFWVGRAKSRLDFHRVWPETYIIQEVKIFLIIFRLKNSQVLFCVAD
jgi:hypothetical protein